MQKARATTFLWTGQVQGTERRAMKAPRSGWNVALGGGGSVAVPSAAAGPDEREALTILIAEEIGMDRSGKARVVQRDRKIIATFVGAF